jgi:hypothetical protein
MAVMATLSTFLLALVDHAEAWKSATLYRTVLVDALWAAFGLSVVAVLFTAAIPPEAGTGATHWVDWITGGSSGGGEVTRTESHEEASSDPDTAIDELAPGEGVLAWRRWVRRQQQAASQAKEKHTT